MATIFPSLPRKCRGLSLLAQKPGEAPHSISLDFFLSCLKQRSSASPSFFPSLLLSLEQLLSICCVLGTGDRAVRGFPGSSDGKESACSVGDLGLIPGSGRSPRDRNGNPLQNSCLENITDRGAWQATVHGIPKGQTRLSN